MVINPILFFGIRKKTKKRHSLHEVCELKNIRTFRRNNLEGGAFKTKYSPQV